MKKIAILFCGIAAVALCSCAKKAAEQVEEEPIDSLEVVVDSIIEEEVIDSVVVEEPVVEEPVKATPKKTSTKKTTTPAVEVKKDEQAPAHGAIKISAGNTEATITPGKATNVEVKNEQLNTAGKVTVTAGGKKAAIAAQQNNQ